MTKNNKSKNLLVVASSSNYLPGINALFNSMDYHKIDTDVLLLSFRLPEDYLKRIQEVFDFDIKILRSEGINQVQDTAIERFKSCCDFGKDYEAILLLDADMYFMSDEANLFFEVASKGFIVTAANNMLINFNEEYQRKYGVDLGAKEYPHIKIHTTAPIWLSPRDLDWFEALYNSKRIDSFDDFLYLNILGIKMAKVKKMICLPSYRLTNIHHFSMKIETGMIKKNELILSGTEEGMIMNHGKFWDESYYGDLFKVMQRYLKNEGFGKHFEERVLNSRKIMLEEFIKYCYFQKVSIKDFQPISWLEKKINGNKLLTQD